MRIEGVLLGTIEEQIAGGDPNPIDPALVTIAKFAGVPLTIGFDKTKLVGQVHRIWLEDGRLMFAADVDDERAGLMLPAKAAIGVTGARHDNGVIRDAVVYEVGLCNENQNRHQPDWTTPSLTGSKDQL